MARLIAGALIAFLILAHPNESRADVWNWLTGLVTTHPDSEAAALSGVALPPGAIVAKGDKRVLRMGRDVLELYPSTAITIDETGPNTSVRLITGTVRVKVAKRKKGQVFDVRTLTLVATVKGTEFEVSTTVNGSAVSVHEGRVAVKAAGRVGGIDVTPGKTATVNDAENAPSLGPTPSGGAAAAAKALGRPSKANASSSGGSDDNDGRRDHRDIRAPGRATSGTGTNSGSGGGSDSDGEGGEGGDGEGGSDSDGEGGEGGEGGDDDGGEGGEDGEGGDDD